MSVSSLNQTLTAVSNLQISGESLSKPLSGKFERLLDMITFGIYGAYKKSSMKETRNDLLDLGIAFLKWDPARPDIPVSLTSEGKSYEISDTPNGGVRLSDRASGEAVEIENITISSIRDMVVLDLMSQPDFSEDIRKRVYDDSSSVHLDFVGIKQERANACGEAAKNMILAYHGLDYDPATNSRMILEPAYQEDILLELQGRGVEPLPLRPQWDKAYTCEQIREGLETGPLLAVLGHHYVAVHGVNEVLGRVDVFCPLLGNRSCSLADFNAHLAWDPNVDGDDDEPPLSQFRKMSTSTDETPTGFGKSRDPDFAPTLLDRLGVKIVKEGSAIGNSWLKSPEDFAKTLP